MKRLKTLLSFGQPEEQAPEPENQEDLEKEENQENQEDQEEETHRDSPDSPDDLDSRENPEAEPEAEPEGEGEAEPAAPESDDPVDRLAATIVSEAAAGALGEETRALLAKALDYEHAIAVAEQRGEIRGRNANIEERMRDATDSDGVPHPGCGQGAPLRSAPTSIFDLAREARY